MLGWREFQVHANIVRKQLEIMAYIVRNGGWLDTAAMRATGESGDPSPVVLRLDIPAN